MSLWTEIVNTALIGCERKPLSLNRQEGQLGVLLAQFDQNDREGSLLGVAALVSLYDRAATLPEKDEQPLPEACVPDDAPRCSELAASRLAIMLRGEYEDHLDEWLKKAEENGLRAPEELLPQLLEHGRMREWSRKEIARALGERGRWLQAQNPNWDFPADAADEFDKTLLETGRIDQPFEFFRRLRRRDASRARELLMSRWEKESPKDRSTLLSLFKWGLSSDDEAFLEWALNDKRNDVREVAADLLARLPGSALSHRMFERARSLLSFKLNGPKSREIEITLPEKRDKAMQRDRVKLKPASYFSLGEKAFWLQEMLGSIPPKFWLQESGWTISELIDAAKKTEWKDVLIVGWTNAAVRSEDEEWAEALLAEDSVYKGIDVANLFEVLPQTRQESFTVEFLKKHPSLASIEPAYIFVRSLYWGPQWGEALSRAVIDCLIQQLPAHGIPNIWWSVFTDGIGHKLDPTVIPETIARFNDAMKPPAARAPEVERFLNLIQFRYEMLNEF